MIMHAESVIAEYGSQGSTSKMFQMNSIHILEKHCSNVTSSLYPLFLGKNGIIQHRIFIMTQKLPLWANPVTTVDFFFTVDYVG